MRKIIFLFIFSLFFLPLQLQAGSFFDTIQGAAGDEPPPGAQPATQKSEAVATGSSSQGKIAVLGKKNHTITFTKNVIVALAKKLAGIDFSKLTIYLPVPGGTNFKPLVIGLGSNTVRIIPTPIASAAHVAGISFPRDFKPPKLPINKPDLPKPPIGTGSVDIPEKPKLPPIADPGQKTPKDPIGTGSVNIPEKPRDPGNEKPRPPIVDPGVSGKPGSTDPGSSETPNKPKPPIDEPVASGPITVNPKPPRPPEPSGNYPATGTISVKPPTKPVPPKKPESKPTPKPTITPKPVLPATSTAGITQQGPHKPPRGECIKCHKR